MEIFKKSCISGTLSLGIKPYNKRFILPGCNRIRVAHLMSLTANNNYLGWQGYTGSSLLARMAHNRRSSYVR